MTILQSFRASFAPPSRVRATPSCAAIARRARCRRTHMPSAREDPSRNRPLHSGRCRGAGRPGAIGRRQPDQHRRRETGPAMQVSARLSRPSSSSRSSTHRCASLGRYAREHGRVLASPRQLGYGQLDVFALESRQLKTEAALTIVRQDDVRECVFAVTRKQGHLQLRRARRQRRQAAVHSTAGRLGQRRHLPSSCARSMPTASGKAKSVSNAASTDDAIRRDAQLPTTP